MNRQIGCLGALLTTEELGQPGDFAVGPRSFGIGGLWSECGNLQEWGWHGFGLGTGAASWAFMKKMLESVRNR